MKKLWPILIIVIITICLIVGLIVIDSIQTNNDAITNFETCAKKYPILETFPEMCKVPNGPTYTK